MHKPRGCGAKKSLTYKYLGYRRTMRRGNLDSNLSRGKRAAEDFTQLHRSLFHRGRRPRDNAAEMTEY